jgi:hypothetical protein
MDTWIRCYLRSSILLQNLLVELRWRLRSRFRVFEIKREQNYVVRETSEKRSPDGTIQQPTAITFVESSSLILR